MNSNGHSTEPLDYAKYSILIVDDTPVNLSVIVDFLQGYGFNVRITRNGTNALKRVQYDQPDLILLDILMPGIDGFETCRRLKDNTITRDIPIIFMTSLTSVEDKVRGFEAGAVDYVTKPLQQEEVMARITAHLRSRDLTQTLIQENEQLYASSQIERTRFIDAVNQQRAQLRALTRKLTETQETERKQLARELHDEMGQALTAININLSAVIQSLDETAPPKMKARLVEANELATQTVEQVRELSLNLRPPMLDDVGLLPTLEWYVKRFDERVNTQTQLDVTGFEARASSVVETAIYRIVQEALTNIARHSAAASVSLILEQTADEIIIKIEDDGQGFDIQQVLDMATPYYGATPNGETSHGMGLLGIRERVLLLNGRFDIHSELGQGTRLSIVIPQEIDHVSD